MFSKLTVFDMYLTVCTIDTDLIAIKKANIVKPTFGVWRKINGGLADIACICCRDSSTQDSTIG